LRSGAGSALPSADRSIVAGRAPRSGPKRTSSRAALRRGDSIRADDASSSSSFTRRIGARRSHVHASRIVRELDCSTRARHTKRNAKIQHRRASRTADGVTLARLQVIGIALIAACRPHRPRRGMVVPPTPAAQRRSGIGSVERRGER